MEVLVLILVLISFYSFYLKMNQPSQDLMFILIIAATINHSVNAENSNRELCSVREVVLCFFTGTAFVTSNTRAMHNHGPSW